MQKCLFSYRKVLLTLNVAHPLELLWSNSTTKSPKRIWKNTDMNSSEVVCSIILITFLFHKERCFCSSHCVVHQAYILTKGIIITSCYSDGELVGSSCGDDTAILNPWNVTGGGVSTISSADESGVLIDPESWSARLERNYSRLCWMMRTFVL